MLFRVLTGNAPRAAAKVPVSDGGLDIKAMAVKFVPGLGQALSVMTTLKGQCVSVDATQLPLTPQ